MSWEVEWSEEGYKSALILSEMVYVKQMHEDCFSLVSESFSIKRKLAMEEEEEEAGRRSKKSGRQQFPRCCVLLGYLRPRPEEEMTIYWVRHKGD